MASPAARLTKKKLTITAAVEQWLEADAEIARLSALRNEAKAVIVPHMEDKGLDVYKGIRREVGGGNLILDQAAVKIFLGPRLTEFQTRSSTSTSLKRVK